MCKQNFYLWFVAAMALGCGNDNPAVQNATPVGERQWIKSETGDRKEELKANAIPIDDTQALVRYSLQTLQEAYNKANGKVPNVGKVTVLVDDNLNMVLNNEQGLNTTTSVVNLKSLNSDPQKLGIIVNRNADEFPGLKIYVRQGEPKVEITKNGKDPVKQDFLEIILADRTDVERVASALLTAAESAQGILPEEGTKQK